MKIIVQEEIEKKKRIRRTNFTIGPALNTIWIISLVRGCDIKTNPY